MFIENQMIIKLFDPIRPPAKPMAGRGSHIGLLLLIFYKHPPVRPAGVIPPGYFKSIRLCGERQQSKLLRGLLKQDKVFNAGFAFSRH
jgi:hypothetical protein